MQEITLKQGAASVKFRVKLYDSSVTTELVGLTGLTSGSAGLTISTIHDNEAAPVSYTGANLETITTLGTYAAPTVNKCRFREVSAANLPGIYEIQLADTRFSGNLTSKELLISINGATNLMQTEVSIKLVSDDPHTAKPANFNSLAITAAGRVDVGAVSGTTQTAVDIGSGVKVQSGTGTGQISLASGLVDITQGAADKAWNSASRSLTGVTNIVSGGAITTSGGAVSNVTTVDSTTDVTNGVTLNPAATSAALVSAIVSAIDSSSLSVGEILADTTAILAAVDTEIAAIKTKTDQLTFTDTGKVDSTIQLAADIKVAALNAIADHVLRRDLATAEDSVGPDTKAFKSLLGAASKLTNKVNVNAGVMTTYETDGITVLGTQAVTTSPTAEPLVGLG